MIAPTDKTQTTRVPLWGKIDPAFVVTLMFTAVSAWLTQPFWSFELWEKAPATVQQSSGPPVLRIDSDRSIRIEGKVVALKDVPNQIQDVLSGRTARLVSFEADAQTRYGYAARVMEQVRRGGGDPRISRDAEGSMATNSN